MTWAKTAQNIRVISDGTPWRPLVHIEDIAAAALCAADIGLAPYADGAPAYFSPLKLFEYMAAGLAVVAGDLPGVRDAVGEDGALLVPPGDATALAESVGALAADRDLRLALGGAARARALAEHTWPQRARRVLSAVSETLTGVRYEALAGG